MIELQKLAECTENGLNGKRVYCHVDFNVSITKKGTIVDDFRIDTALKTILFLTERGARVVLNSHLKRDKREASLRVVSDFLQEQLPHIFIEDLFSESGQTQFSSLQPGEVALLENVRLNEGEKENDPEYSRQLAELFDLYVNEAFSDAHRAHASVVGVPSYIPGYAGFQFVREVERLSEAFEPSRPFVFILGGAKFETKLPLIEKFLDRADTVFVGGALANDFFVAQGKPVGRSLVSDKHFDLSPYLNHSSLMLPVDVIAEDSTRKRRIRTLDEVGADETIWDAGPHTLKRLGEKIAEASCVLWNGPLGNYEAGYTEGTHEVARAIAASRTESIVGGGDTRAALTELNLFRNFSFVSTGGGAMLDFLANETLPGIEVLKVS